MGRLYAILIDSATAIAAVWLISAAIMGYSVRMLRLVDRAIYLIAGACLMLPISIFAGARWINFAGALLAVCAPALGADAEKGVRSSPRHRGRQRIKKPRRRCSQ